MDLAPIAQRIHALGLQGTVELRAQRQTEQQMADLFEQADCFVLAYRQIDASGVYFLVRALNKWIVATRVGIFAEDLRADVDGQLVAVGSVSELAQALAHAVQTRPRPAAPPAQASWPAIGRTTRALYERVGERVSERVGARPRRPAAAGAAAARGADPRAQDPRP
jgi:glycosyltransferase involved in cell wall biosynthesis